MNKKVSLLIISVILAIVAFIASTYIQKKAVNYVPTIKCLVINKDLDEYVSVHREDIVEVDMPIAIVANTKVVKDYDEISDLFLKSKIYKGQMLIREQFDTADKLLIFNGEEGKEKISIKVRNPENAVSYIIKPGSSINVYATLNSDYAKFGLLKEMDKKYIGDDSSGYAIIKVLSNVKVISTFDENGEEVDKMPERTIDTVLLSVTSEEASIINLIREIATFNITEI